MFEGLQCHQNALDLHNYPNFQSVCLHQNVHDIARYLLETNNHVQKIHQDLGRSLNLFAHIPSLNENFSKIILTKQRIATL